MMMGGNPKLFKLDSNLTSTSYNNKNEVRRACEELIRNYDGLDSYNIPNPIIGAPPTRVIELFGTIPVNFKNHVYHMMMSFIFPPLFPNVPPLVHFANPDSKKYVALEKYDSKKFLAPNGKYYYPLNFSEVQSWMSHRSVMRIVTQIIKEFSAEYPIYAGNPTQISNQTNIQKPILFPTNPGINPIGYMPQQQQQQQQYQQQQHQQQQQTYQNTNNLAQNVNTNIIGNYNTQTSQFQNAGKSPKDQLLAPLQTRYKEEALGIARKLEKDLNLQRNNMVELQNLYLKLQEEQEKLQKFELNVPVVTSELEAKVQGLNQIISTHEGTVLSMDTLSTVIDEEDEASKMLLDLMTTNKAIEDLNLLVEDLFNVGRIDLDTYLKIYKDNTEREFLNNVIMKKILTEQQLQQV